MVRFTRRKDKFPCRIAGGCPAEGWIEKVTGVPIYRWNKGACDNCPFEKYLTLLAEYEDEAENMEDDRK